MKTPQDRRAEGVWRGLRALLRPLLDALKAPGQRRGTPQTRMGRKAEKEAERYFRKNGYRILARNFASTYGEIDLIVFKDGVVAFVEVRSRTDPAEPDPLYSVTRGKQRRILRAAQLYVKRYGLGREDVDLRFDVVAVRYDGEGKLSGIEHIPNAFQA